MAAHRQGPAQPISEQTIPSKADSLFLLGGELANYNSNGLILQDLNQSAFFSLTLGKWVISEEDFINADISMENVKGQFKDLDAFLDKSLQTGLLSGYAQKALYLIEPFQEGFTQSLLNQFFPNQYYVPAPPQGDTFEVEKLLSFYRLKLSLKKPEPLLVPTPNKREGLTLPERHILITAVLLLLADIDIKPFIVEGEQISPHSTTFKILAALLRKDYTKEAKFTGLLPRLLGIKGPKDHLSDLLLTQTQDERKLLQLIGQQLENPAQRSDLDHHTFLIQSLKSIFEINKLKVNVERQSFLEALSEGLLKLAISAEKQGNLLESVYLAQTSRILLQWMVTNWEEVELRLSKAEHDEQQLAWARQATIDNMDTDELMNICAYANTATIADLLYFKYSREYFLHDKATNHLWSAIFRAIDRQRWITCLMDAYMKSPLYSKEIEAHFQVIFTGNLKQFQSALAQHMKAAHALFEKGLSSPLTQCWLQKETGQEKTLMLELELEQVTLLVDALDQQGLNEHTMALFERLLQLIKRSKDSPLESNSSADAIGEGSELEGNIQSQIDAFNELMEKYHNGEDNLLEGFQALLDQAREARLQQYCALMILLLATKEKQWEVALMMATYLHDTIASAWDLPGISIKYYGNFFGEEHLKIDPVLDALKTLSEYYPQQQVLTNLIDRYLERYVAE